VIVSLEGALAGVDILSVVIEINGIGYLVNVPLTVSCKLPPIGERVKLQIYPVYREDRQDLYGFLTEEERNFFKLMVEKVSGIGPRSALSIMSKLSIAALGEAVATGNADILAKCHGIGKKSAERIIMELSPRDVSKISPRTGGVLPQKFATATNANDAVAALISLGYKGVDAERAVSKAVEKLGTDTTTDRIIRSALST
jgi:Holliday junction DNA helicase RuvA